MPADPTITFVEIERLAASLPDRFPAQVRIGPHVLPILRDAATAPRFGVSIPLGVSVVLDDQLPPGAWRILDQHGEEMRAGNLWPPDLPVVESEFLPDGTHAIVFAPEATDAHGPEPCVIVRAGGGR